MSRPIRLLGQGVTWAALALLIAAFAQGPAFSPVPDGHGELKLSIARLSDRLEPCRQLTEEERQKLPPTRRAIEVCERERSPIWVRLNVDGETLTEQTIKPAGWHRDGRSYRLKFFTLPAGQYKLELALRDSPREDGYDMHKILELMLEPGDSALLEIGDGDVMLRNPGSR